MSERTIYSKLNSKRLFWFVSLFLIINIGGVLQVFSQTNQYTIQGNVCDLNKETLPGVSIKIKGTSMGVITDLDGNYSIEVPSKTSVLVFSYIGFQIQEITVGNNTKLDVVLKEEAREMEEVVVVAYGTQKKQTVTGAISSMKGADLLETPTANISNALTGKLPGVVTQQAGGRPGEDAAQIYIRGRGDALIVIDGIEQESFEQLDPNEIQSISILKDASATAVYGIRGASGVILITTKRGVEGKPKVSLSANWGIQQPTKVPEFLGSYDHLRLKKLAYENDNVDPMTTSEAAFFTDTALEGFRLGQDKYRYPNVNWYDEVVKKSGSLQQQYNINVSGGAERVKYFVSLGFLDQGGMFKYQDLQKEYDPGAWYKRFNFRTNVDIQINKYQTLSTNLTARSEEINGKSILSGQTSGYGGFYQTLLAREPWRMPVFNPNGSISALSAIGNPISTLAYGGNDNVKNNVFDIIGTLKNDLGFITKGLTFDLSLTFSNKYGSRKSYNQSIDTYQYDPIADEYIQIGEKSPYSFSAETKSGAMSRVNLQLRLAYNKKIEKHEVTSVLVYNQQKYKSGNNSDQLSLIPSAVMGYAFRLEYNYAYKYLAEFSLGYNGSENFAKGHRFGTFPAGSLGYVVSEEPFMESIKPILPYLKIRGSVGLVGKDNSNSRFLYMGMFETQDPSSGFVGGYPSFMFGTYNPSSNGGIYEQRNENKLLTWETSLKQNVGVEGRLFDSDLLSFGLDLFQDKRRDILLASTANLPAIVGLDGAYANKGRIDYWGYEVDLLHRNKIRDFEYSLRGTYSFARNKVLEWDDPAGMEYWMKDAGYREGQFKGYIVKGYFQDEDDIKNSPSQAELGGPIKPGDLKYVDFNEDGKIDNKDMVPMGYSRVPEISYSIMPSFSWKGFELSAMFQGVANASLMLQGNAGFEFYGSAGGGQVTKDHLNYWTPDNQDGAYPTLHVGAHSNKQINSFHIQSANFIRLKSMQFGYNFPSALCKKMSLSGLKVYLSGSNLYTWTKVKNFDPEMVNTSGDVYPQQRVFNLGVNVNF